MFGFDPRVASYRFPTLIFIEQIFDFYRGNLRLVLVSLHESFVETVDMKFFQAAAILFSLCFLPSLYGQEKQTLDANDPAAKYEDKRVLGVLPNYRTAELTSDYHPISAHYKLEIALKDSFDYPLFAIGSIYAGVYMAEDSHPQFGQGVAGYLRRFGTSSADQVIGNMMTEGFMPILLHEDPRYFRMSTGPVGKRLRYAVSRIFITRTDLGKPTFNYAEVIGNGVSSAIGLSYYSDNRNLEDYSENWATQLATDAFSQVLKEFWPDIKRHYKHKHDKDNQPLVNSMTN
jgi:hypothetical protein